MYDLFHFLFVKWKHTTTIWFTIISLVFLLICLICKIKYSLSFRKTIQLYLVIEYIILLLLSTVFTRRILEAPRVETSLLWSYRWGYKLYGWRKIITENCINVFLLVPVATLLLKMNRNKNRYAFVVALGLAISLCIELLQFVFCRGTLEIDDLFHNMIGVALVIIVDNTIKNTKQENTK